MTTPEDTELRDQITTHVIDAMGDFPTPYLLEWHTDIFLSIITLHTQKAYQDGYDDCLFNIPSKYAITTNPTEPTNDLKTGIEKCLNPTRGGEK